MVGLLGRFDIALDLEALLVTLGPVEAVALRQSRRRLVHQVACPRELLPLGHGRRRRRTPGPPGLARRSRRRSVDGRDDRAHLVIDDPDKVLGLCSIYTAPDASYLTSDPEAWDVRNEPPSESRDEAIEQSISGLYELDDG